MGNAQDAIAFAGATPFADRCQGYAQRRVPEAKDEHP